MQLSFLKASLPFVLSATMMAGQQSKPASTAQTTQQSAAKEVTPHARPKTVPAAKARHRVVRKRYSKAARRRGAKRAAYRPEYAEHSVEVINGASTKQVVFDEEKKPARSAKGESPQMKVDVVNGSETDTQYFYAGNGQAPITKRPVVVNIQSSDTRVVGGNKHPVVTGITAVGPIDAKSTNNGGQKVTTGVSPQPKRPEYKPETH